MKALGTTKLRKAVKDMRPGIIVVRKADNQVIAYYGNDHGCQIIPIEGFDYKNCMIYYKEPKKC